jgi:hypothetical protein
MGRLLTLASKPLQIFLMNYSGEATPEPGVWLANPAASSQRGGVTELTKTPGLGGL